MKLSSFTKYLHLRVINTGVTRAVAGAAAILLLSAFPAKAQDGPARPSKEVAQAAWIKGDFEKAYTNYNGLLLLYSRDPLYQYYTGACLVRLERDIQRGVTLLASAINSSVNIKSVPDDVWFWYGRALQMSGNFTQAAEAFDRFSRQAGRKVATEYEVQKYIDQCRAGQQDRSAVPVSSTGQQSAERETGKSADIKEKTKEAVAGVVPAEAKVPVREKPVVRGDTTGIPAEYFRVLGESLERGEKADSLLLALGKRNSNNKSVAPVQHAEPPAAGQLSRFGVLPGNAYGQNNPVPVEPALPGGLIYTIQIAAFRNDVAPSLFRGLDPVFGKHRQGSEAVYYYTGLFRRIDDARNALPQAKGAGFPDAFVIAMMDGVQVSIERATILEKEWGIRPLDSAGSASPVSPAATQSRPVPVGTLSFRAEVMRITKPVKPEVIQKIELLAGTRGLDMIKNSSGETVFLIGNFITFESADEYVSLLIRNGYNTARVTAYVGTQEIPVEAAMDLINKLPDD
jgi:tetratricopeptide (TPR) repeat protein